MSDKPKTPGEAAREAFYKASGLDMRFVKDARSAAWDAAAKAAIDVHYKGPECKTIVKIEGNNGKLTSLYLRDGIRVTIGRTAETKGQAWLEVRDTPTVDALSQQPLAETDSENAPGTIGEI